jgi:hypothetical protein
MKGKLSLFTKQRYEGGKDVQLHSFLTLEQNESEWPALLPSFFTLSERATHWLLGRGGWWPRTDLDVVKERKIFCPENRFLALKKIK